MSKKFKVVISVLVALLLLTASGTAVAMAQEEPEPDPTGISRSFSQNSRNSGNSARRFDWCIEAVATGDTGGVPGQREWY